MILTKSSDGLKTIKLTHHVWHPENQSAVPLNQQQGVSDRLEIKPEESLTTWLGNPCPGVVKTLRVRYVSLEGVAKGHRREVWLQESEVGGYCITRVGGGWVLYCNVKIYKISKFVEEIAIVSDACLLYARCSAEFFRGSSLDYNIVFLT